MQDTLFYVYIAVMRYLLPLLVIVLLIRCGLSLLCFRRQPEIWGWLCLEDGTRKALTHWETLIGRSKSCDVVLEGENVAPSHAVLVHYDDGSWAINCVRSQFPMYINGMKKTNCVIGPEDTVTLGDVSMMLQPIATRQKRQLSVMRKTPNGSLHSVVNVMLLSVIQCLCCIGCLLSGTEGYANQIVIGFLGLMLCQTALMIFFMKVKRTAIDLEILAFLLCTMGMAVMASQNPWEIPKQLAAVVLGIAVFVFTGWSLRSLDRARIFSYGAAVLSVALLVLTLIFGEEQYGSKSWIIIGGFSVQPSELCKMCFVYAGASTLDRLVTSQSTWKYIVYSLVICALIVLMNDFGTALVFFAAFLIIAFLRSGSFGTVALSITAVGLAGAAALKLVPHALRRFAVWGHAWEDALDKGYQQTRSMICIASGGLLGLGPGEGWLGDVFAADSDLVFASVSEEWGFLIAVLMVVCVVLMALFALRTLPLTRSSFYAITSAAAVGILLTQTVLNVLGTVDVLPLTGITFPFLSNGGSSMIAAWGLLAFVKAADTRQNASFAVTLAREGRDRDE